MSALHLSCCPAQSKAESKAATLEANTASLMGRLREAESRASALEANTPLLMARLREAEEGRAVAEA